MQGGPPRTQSFSGQYPVRLEGAPNSVLTGLGQWRGVRDFEHSTLCRAFGLDPNRFYFDLPSSVRMLGSNMAGAGGSGRVGRVQNGFVFMSGIDAPVGKLTICREGERFKDVDPMNDSDFYDLGHT
jgi:hypothetical protein